MNRDLDRKKLIGWGISILALVSIALIPVSADFTKSLKLFFCITLFMILIIAFELLPQLISAVMLPSLYVISGLVPMEAAFSSWTSTTVWMVFGGLIFSHVLDECGLLKRIAYYVIRKCGGTYAGAVFGCFFIGIILNLITFCYGWLVVSVLVFGVCKAMELKPSGKSSLVCFAGTIGATGATIFMYYPGYYAMIESAIRQLIPDYTMNMFSTFLYNGFALLFYILTLLILMKVYKTKEMDQTFRKEIFNEKYAELGDMTKKEKKAVFMVVLLLVYLFTTRFTGLPAAYGFISVPFLMFLPGIEIGDNVTIGRLNFSMVFFVSSCLGIGVVGAKAGFGEFLANIAVPMLSGKSPLVTCIALMLFGMIANFFMTPFAMLGGLSLPFAQIAVSLGMSPVPVIMILLYSCELVLLPYQSAGNLMMYSFGMMPMKDFIKQEGLKAVIMITGFLIVMYPLWKLFGLM